MDPRACWYIPKKSGKWRGGKLHGWSTDNESLETSMPIPVGIVEDEKTGHVHSVYVERICFAAVPSMGEIDRS